MTFVRSGLFVAEGSSDEPLAGIVEDLFLERGVELLPARHREIVDAMAMSGCQRPAVPVIPVRMTEAWLLLSERDIRVVAGNPNGRAPLDLPKHHEVEGIADPKSVLRRAILAAAEATGRRRDRLERRIDESRRQLLEGLDRSGPITRLASWRALIDHVDRVAQGWS